MSYRLCMSTGAPSGVILEKFKQNRLRGFLWSQGSLQRGKSNVAWEVVCLPKTEGGLGIRRLHEFNVALLSVHIWNLLTRKESLWVQQIYMYTNKGEELLEYSLSWEYDMELEEDFANQAIDS